MPRRWRGGSSPRARGTRLGVANQQPQQRFIPACAGNTSRSTLSSRPSAVHPRVRGEHRPTIEDPVSSIGSSPRARGTLYNSLPGILRGRFIPACAGNTLGRWRVSDTRPVHPRVRGEHYRSRKSAEKDHGSSPRARGTRCRRYSWGTQSRFIPACAGNTAGRCKPTAAAAVHPRVRGEHRRRSH